MTLQETIIAEEYKAARARIDKEIDFINTLETTFVLAAGAIVAFVFNKDGSQLVLFRVSMLLISLLSFYGLWRYNLHRKVLRIHELYIKENIEPILSSGALPTVGLVSHYDDKKSLSIKQIDATTKSGTLKRARQALWVVLIIASLGAFAFSFCDPHLLGLFK